MTATEKIAFFIAFFSIVGSCVVLAAAVLENNERVGRWADAMARIVFPARDGWR